MANREFRTIGSRPTPPPGERVGPRLDATRRQHPTPGFRLTGSRVPMAGRFLARRLLEVVSPPPVVVPSDTVRQCVAE